MKITEKAPGRLQDRAPVAIIDIGSNSVRLVVYEGPTRSPTPIFNEKVLAGLGRSVATTGKLDADAIERAGNALGRYKALADQLGATRLHVIATAAVREAANGSEFIARCQALCGTDVEILSGAREAHLTALGVISGFLKPEGVAADLGGGSLELIQVRNAKFARGTTLPLGGLRLEDMSGGSKQLAARMVRREIQAAKVMKAAKGKSIYAIGGTFRALANLHMAQRGYPLHVMHHYVIPAKEALDFTRMVRRADPAAIGGIETVSSARRPLLVYGALVLENLVRFGAPRDVVISALGVREGLLYELLDKQQRKRDPLIEACRELALLRSRSPQHAEELCKWTDMLFGHDDLPETAAERRLRHAACLLADIGWRAHPDYRGEQSLNIIAHATFIGIDHPGRAYLSLAIFYRNAGLIDEHLSPKVRELASSWLLDRARLLGAALRVAHLVSAAAPGIITRTPIRLERDKLVLVLPGDLARLKGERLSNRLRQLARLMGRQPEIRTPA